MDDMHPPQAQKRWRNQEIIDDPRAAQSATSGAVTNSGDGHNHMGTLLGSARLATGHTFASLASFRSRVGSPAQPSSRHGAVNAIAGLWRVVGAGHYERTHFLRRSALPERWHGAHRSRPLSARFEPVLALRGVNAGSSRTPFRHARRTQPIWPYWSVPALSGPACHPPRRHPGQAALSSIRLLRQDRR
jgi:hypothetical protein